MTRKGKDRETPLDPEGLERFRSLVEGSARKLREGEKRMKERQRQNDAADTDSTGAEELSGTPGNIPESMPDNIPENIPEKRRGFFDKSVGIPNNQAEPRLKLPPPVLHRVSPVKQTRGRPAFSGNMQQAIIKCLLDRGLSGTTYKQITQVTGIAQPHITRTVKALVEGGFIEKAVDRANRNVLIPLDILRSLWINDYPESAYIPENMPESIPENIPVNGPGFPSEESRIESNSSVHSEVTAYQRNLDEKTEAEWKEEYPFLSQLGITLKIVKSAFLTQQKKGMANVSSFQKALLKCEFEAQNVIENGYEVIDKKGEKIKNLVSYYRFTLSVYGDYRNPEGWEDPEVKRYRELSELAEKIKAQREDALGLFFRNWMDRLKESDRMRLLEHFRSLDKKLKMVSDDRALRMIFDNHADSLIQWLQQDLFSAYPPGFLPGD